MPRSLAKAGGISKGVAQGLAGFFDFKRSFEDAVRKNKWEKERIAIEAREKRTQSAVEGGFIEPENWTSYLAKGDVGKYTTSTYSGYGKGSEFPKTQGDLQLKWVRFTKMGNRMVAVPTYGRSFELSSTILQNMMGDPQAYNLSEKEVGELAEWLKSQTFKSIRGGGGVSSGNLPEENEEEFWDQFK